MFQLEDDRYRPLEPSTIRLPPPAPPNDRLLAAVDAFYASPNHERPRDKSVPPVTLSPKSSPYHILKLVQMQAVYLTTLFSLSYVLVLYYYSATIGVRKLARLR